LPVYRLEIASTEPFMYVQEKGGLAMYYLNISISPPLDILGLIRVLGQLIFK